jgi:hypothetical protein
MLLGAKAVTNSVIIVGLLWCVSQVALGQGDEKPQTQPAEKNPSDRDSTTRTITALASVVGAVVASANLYMSWRNARRDRNERDKYDNALVLGDFRTRVDYARATLRQIQSQLAENRQHGSPKQALDYVFWGSEEEAEEGAVSVRHLAKLRRSEIAHSPTTRSALQLFEAQLQKINELTANPPSDPELITKGLALIGDVSESLEAVRTCLHNSFR